VWTEINLLTSMQPFPQVFVAFKSVHRNVQCLHYWSICKNILFFLLSQKCSVSLWRHISSVGMLIPVKMNFPLLICTCSDGYISQDRLFACISQCMGCSAHRHLSWAAVTEAPRLTGHTTWPFILRMQLLGLFLTPVLVTELIWTRRLS
jgi:hypothetical protein